jgi:opacity protein-like surface antigen
MKIAILSIVATLAFAASLYAEFGAGSNGCGPYIGVEGGFNLMQSGINGYGWDEVNKLGWATGVKAGYEFNTGGGLVVPALELECLYTKFEHHWVGDVWGDSVTEKAKVKTFSCLVNGILNFNLGALQPYVGMGAGMYTANAKYSSVYSGYSEFNDGNQDRDGFAWQVLLGLDYFFTPSVSVFTEYKWLDCMVNNGDSFLGNDNFGQHLLTVGMKLHF